MAAACRTSVEGLNSGLQHRKLACGHQVEPTKLHRFIGPRGTRLVTQASGNKGAGSQGPSGRRDRQPGKRARQPGLFEVKVVTPPPRSLGIYALPPLTHNGEEIEVDGEGYVVTGVVVHYKLMKGRYVRDHNKLEVQPTSRYFLNMMLDNLVKARYIGPTGAQD